MIHRLELHEQEVNFLGLLLNSVPLGQAVNAGMTHLPQKIAEQINENLRRDKLLSEEAARNALAAAIK